jgi:hypothetical protein
MFGVGKAGKICRAKQYEFHPEEVVIEKDDSLYDKRPAVAPTIGLRQRGQLSSAFSGSGRRKCLIWTFEHLTFAVDAAGL